MLGAWSSEMNNASCLNCIKLSLFSKIVTYLYEDSGMRYDVDMSIKSSLAIY